MFFVLRDDTLDGISVVVFGIVGFESGRACAFVAIGCVAVVRIWLPPLLSARELFFEAVMDVIEDELQMVLVLELLGKGVPSQQTYNSERVFDLVRKFTAA